MMIEGISSTALGLGFVAIIIGAAIWTSRRRRAEWPPLPDDRPDLPYAVYTSAFDIEVVSATLRDTLPASNPDAERGFTDRNGSAWRKLIADFSRWQKHHAPMQHQVERLLSASEIDATVAETTAICILVDQSGSMKEQRIAAIASALGMVSASLSQLAIPHEILGFSTAGWQGGFARRQWLGDGKPPYPGRLCALLHIVHKSADEPWSESAQQLMLLPDALRENIDGEAIEWAAARLTRLDKPRKLLLVISDGAPVDDATLSANGPNILVRHLLSVITRLDASEEFKIGAVGIEHRVSDYYSSSTQAELAGLPVAIATQLRAMLVD